MLPGMGGYWGRIESVAAVWASGIGAGELLAPGTSALGRQIGLGALVLSVVLFGLARFNWVRQLKRDRRAAHRRELVEYARWLQSRNGQGETEWPLSDETPLFREHFPHLASLLDQWWRREKLRTRSPGLWEATEPAIPRTLFWPPLLDAAAGGEVTGSCRRCREADAEVSPAAQRSPPRAIRGPSLQPPSLGSGDKG